MADASGGSSVDKTLAIKIKPTLDIDALASQIKEALVKAGLKIPLAAQASDSTSPKKSRKKGSITDTDDDDDDRKEGDNSKAVSAIRAVGAVTKIGFDLAQQTFNGIFGIIKDIHERVKQSSAFLATVENLFNLAMTLLLMPLGNAIADVILPKTIDLVDGVLGLWEEFEKYTGKDGLKNIISIVMDKGIKLVGEYLLNLGDIFTDTGDTLLSSIGHLFNTLGKWLENGKLVGILKALFNIFEKFADHIDLWIPLIIGYQSAQLIATIAAAATNNVFGWTGANAFIVPAATAAGGLAGFGISYGYLNSADGGEVPHTTGGQMIRVAEHEDEVIIPKSKLQGMGGNTYYYTVNGYTTEEVKQLIRDYISSEISNSQYRSGL